MRRSAAIVTLTLTALFATATLARAQDDNVLAVGASVTGRIAPTNDVAGSTSFGLAWRFGHSDPGWGVATGLGWFATDISQPVGGASTELGELHVRPFLAGYGYTYRTGRTAVSAELLSGYAFVSLHQSRTAADVYRDRLGADLQNVRSSNAFVIRPQVNVWVDVSRTIGLNVSTGYSVVRPKLTVQTSLGEEEARFRADMIFVSAGIVYKLF
jgi:hypothetical protein